MKEDLRRRSSSSSSIDVVLVIDIDIIFVRLRIEQTCDRGGHGCHDRLLIVLLLFTMFTCCVLRRLFKLKTWRR